MTTTLRRYMVLAPFTNQNLFRQANNYIWRQLTWSCHKLLLKFGPLNENSWYGYRGTRTLLVMRRLIDWLTKSLTLQWWDQSHHLSVLKRKLAKVHVVSWRNSNSCHTDFVGFAPAGYSPWVWRSFWDVSPQSESHDGFLVLVSNGFP